MNFLLGLLGFSQESNSAGSGIERSSFGPGEAGNTSFSIMLGQPICIECGTNQATHVLSFDVLGQAEFVPACDPCLPVVQAKVSADLVAAGVSLDGTFSLDGFGRA